MQRGGRWPAPLPRAAGPEAASSASMRDVRSLTESLNWAAILSASTLHVLMASTVLTSFSWPAWSALTSNRSRSSFSSAVAIRAVRVGGFLPRSRGLGGGGGEGKLAGCVVVVVVVDISRVNCSGRTRRIEPPRWRVGSDAKCDDN